MYYEYWELKKPPFDNVPDPTMYADCHASIENAIAETLFAIEEGNECVAVIVGDVGLGKTLSLRIIIDSLDQSNYKIALITNPAMSFNELLREIIGQLTGKQCNERRKINLVEIFNKILFETVDEAKKVLIFIDEANAISPANLESLRLLTNMQDDQRNLFTIILAGQNELARRLEHPKRANLLQRIGTFSRIDKIESEDLVKLYVETRLKLAGGTSHIFADDAYGFLWEYSEHGVPRLINKICKLSLKAGETNRFEQISGDVVHQIGERFRNLTGSAVQKRKPRKKPEMKLNTASIEEKKNEVSVEPADFPVDLFLDRRHPADLSAVREEPHGEPAVVEETSPTAVSAADFQPAEAATVEAEEEVPSASETVTELNETFTATQELPLVQKEVIEEIEMAGCRMTIGIPIHLIEHMESSTPEQGLKAAGALAAQLLKKHPELTSSPSVDPIRIWSDIRALILAKFK